MDPLFVPRLARQGKLLLIDNPATWKQSAPSRAAVTSGLNRRLKCFGAAACLAALLGTALPAGRAAHRQTRHTASGATGKAPPFRGHRGVRVPFREEPFTTADAGNTRSLGLESFLRWALAANAPRRHSAITERLTIPPLSPATSKASDSAAAAPTGLVERNPGSLRE